MALGEGSRKRGMEKIRHTASHNNRIAMKVSTGAALSVHLFIGSYGELPHQAANFRENTFSRISLASSCNRRLDRVSNERGRSSGTSITSLTRPGRALM